MSREKNVTGSEPQARETLPAKKRYAKPTLQRLGTVRELTHGTNSKTGK